VFNGTYDDRTNYCGAHDDYPNNDRVFNGTCDGRANHGRADYCGTHDRRANHGRANYCGAYDGSADYCGAYDVRVLTTHTTKEPTNTYANVTILTYIDTGTSHHTICKSFLFHNNFIKK
jgi:hypothetical protein